MRKVGRGTTDILINGQPGAMKFQENTNKPTVTSSPKIFLTKRKPLVNLVKRGAIKGKQQKRLRPAGTHSPSRPPWSLRQCCRLQSHC